MRAPDGEIIMKNLTHREAFATGAAAAAVGATGFIIAPRLAAKLITNPAFVKWVTPLWLSTPETAESY